MFSMGYVTVHVTDPALRVQIAGTQPAVLAAVERGGMRFSRRSDLYLATSFCFTVHELLGARCSRACARANRQKTGHQMTSLNTQIQPKLQGSAPVDAL